MAFGPSIDAVRVAGALALLVAVVGCSSERESPPAAAPLVGAAAVVAEDTAPAASGDVPATAPVEGSGAGAVEAVEPARSSAAPDDAQAVFVNGVRIAPETLAALEDQYGLRVVAGRYWYDAASGAAGAMGGPTAAFLLPGIAIGGPLAADASRGDTGVFVNGRELPASDLAGLEGLVGPIADGRYFIDALGNAGREGEPPTVNLLARAREASAGGSGDGSWYSQGAQAGGNESGGSGYVMGRDASGNVWGASY